MFHLSSKKLFYHNKNEKPSQWTKANDASFIVHGIFVNLKCKDSIHLHNK